MKLRIHILRTVAVIAGIMFLLSYTDYSPATAAKVNIGERVAQKQGHSKSYLERSLFSNHVAARPTDNRTPQHYHHSYSLGASPAFIPDRPALQQLAAGTSTGSCVPSLLYARKLIFPKHWFW